MHSTITTSTWTRGRFGDIVCRDPLRNMWGTCCWTTVAAIASRKGPSISITSLSHAHMIQPPPTAYRYVFRRIQTNVVIPHQLRSPVMVLRLEKQIHPAETADDAHKAVPRHQASCTTPIASQYSSADFPLDSVVHVVLLVR